MTRVYGNQIEPGGMDLCNDYVDCKCPECGSVALYYRWERLEGGVINVNETVHCDHCGCLSGHDGMP